MIQKRTALDSGLTSRYLSADSQSSASTVCAPTRRVVEGCVSTERMFVAKVEGKNCKLWATVKNGYVEILGDAQGFKALAEVCLALSEVSPSALRSAKECGHYEFDDVYANVEAGSASFTITRALDS